MARSCRCSWIIEELAIESFPFNFSNSIKQQEHSLWTWRTRTCHSMSRLGSDCTWSAYHLICMSECLFHILLWIAWPEVAVDFIRIFYFSRNIQHLFAWNSSVCWPVWCGRIHHHDECIITNTINGQISNMDGIKYRNWLNWSHTNVHACARSMGHGIHRETFLFFLELSLSLSLSHKLFHRLLILHVQTAKKTSASVGLDH